MKLMQACLIVILSFSSIHLPNAMGTAPVASFGEWSLFTKERDQQIVCYMLSIPTNKGGNYQIKRGEPFFTVSKLAGDTPAEISVSSGIIYKENSTVDLAIGKRKFSLFTIETKAWSNSVEEDAEIIERLKKGITATVEGQASNGRITKDTYSLSGFTETYNRLIYLCK